MRHSPSAGIHTRAAIDLLNLADTNVLLPKANGASFEPLFFAREA